MAQRFDIIQTKISWLCCILIGGTAPIIALFLLFAIKLPMSWFAISCILFSVSMYALYQLAIKVGGIPMRVSITPGRLLVLNQRSGEEKELQFQQIATYSYTSYEVEQGYELTFRLRAGDVYKLRQGRAHTRNTNFKKMVAAFELALQETDGQKEIPTARKVNPFFERPVATVLVRIFLVLLAFASIIVLLLMWYKPVNPSILIVYGNFLVLVGNISTYARAWYTANRPLGI